MKSQRSAALKDFKRESDSNRLLGVSEQARLFLNLSYMDTAWEVSLIPVLLYSLTWETLNSAQALTWKASVSSLDKVKLCNLIHSTNKSGVSLIRSQWLIYDLHSQWGITAQITGYHSNPSQHGQTNNYKLTRLWCFLKRLLRSAAHTRATCHVWLHIGHVMDKVL